MFVFLFQEFDKELEKTLESLGKRLCIDILLLSCVTGNFQANDDQ